jgi:hypothetical protein
MLDLGRLAPQTPSMSARDVLAHELRSQPDAVARQLLAYLHTLPAATAPVAKEPSQQPSPNYFESYWAQWYGCCADMEWEEAPDLAYETREAW